MNTNIEPAILSASTFFWNSASAASSRRNNEKKNCALVANYLRSIGFEVNQYDTRVLATTEFKGKEIEVIFDYSESCANVYKSLTVTRNGAKSNITTLRKIAQAIQAHDTECAAA